MNLIKSTFIFLLICFNTSQNANIEPFLKFVRLKFQAPESVKRICTWQYAIIKVQTDRNAVIKSYQIENKVSVDLMNSFEFLKGYAFKKDICMRSRVIVFCISIENQRIDNCDVIRPNGYKHIEARQIFNSYKHHHYEREPATIFVDKIITEIIFDPII